MRRGTLRVYIGAAPGVGKTYRALHEIHDLVGQGVDAVVGHVETHGRDETEALLDGLESVPRREVRHRGAKYVEMDTKAILDREPAVVLVDDLAHTNVPGAGHPKRWQDIEDLLEAGVDVISTVNIQHFESLNDVIEDITGVRQDEIIPAHLTHVETHFTGLLSPTELARFMATLRKLRDHLNPGAAQLTPECPS